MFGIGLPELILIMAVALIVVGPEKLPELAKSLGKQVVELKKAANALKNSLNEDEEELKPWEKITPENPQIGEFRPGEDKELFEPATIPEVGVAPSSEDIPEESEDTLADTGDVPDESEDTLADSEDILEESEDIPEESEDTLADTEDTPEESEDIPEEPYNAAKANHEQT